MRVTEEDNSLHIRDVQVVEGWRRHGRGHVSARYGASMGACARTHETQLRVFVDNPAARLYIRMGYKTAGSRLAQLGAIRHMARGV